ncbi:MAG: response regulator transcription factor [Chloroflexia bacterium]
MASDNSGVWFSGSPNSPYGRLRQPGGNIKLLIVDDHALYRQGLRAMFELEPDVEVIGEAADGSEALDKVEAIHPDIVLMDVNMPGMDGMQATRKLADAYPGILIIMLTMFKGEEHLREARRAGASAYVLKDAGSEMLLNTIRDVMGGETPLLQRHGHGVSGKYITDILSSGELDSGPMGSEAPGGGSLITEALLTSNERAILSLLGQGLSNELIANRMGLSDGMVKTYLQEVYRKLGLSGRDEAAQYAREHGMLAD